MSRGTSANYDMMPGSARAYERGRSAGSANSGVRQIKPANMSAAGRYYVDGNTVRAYEPAADAERRAVRRADYERAARAHRRSREASRTRSLSINLPLTLILIVTVAAVLAVGYNYLRLKSSIDIHMDNVKVLETVLEDMKNENDALERSIDTSVDLNYVYDVAVTKLGMVRAGQDNTITYDKTESEYVRQYDSIPTAE